jgi:hypothetical protein
VSKQTEIQFATINNSRDNTVSTALVLKSDKKIECKEVIKTIGRRTAKVLFFSMKTLLFVSYSVVSTVAVAGIKVFQWSLFYHPVLSIGGLAAIVTYWYPALILLFIAPITAMWTQILPWLHSVVEQVFGPPLYKIIYNALQNEANVCKMGNNGLLHFVKHCR